MTLAHMTLMHRNKDITSEHRSMVVQRLNTKCGASHSTRVGNPPKRQGVDVDPKMFQFE